MTFDKWWLVCYNHIIKSVKYLLSPISNDWGYYSLNNSLANDLQILIYSIVGMRPILYRNLFALNVLAWESSTHCCLFLYAKTSYHIPWWICELSGTPKNNFRWSCKAPGVHAEGAEATFDLEESGGLIEYFWWEVSNLHDLIAGASAAGDGLED